MSFDTSLAKQMAKISNYVYDVKSNVAPAYGVDAIDSTDKAPAVTAIAQEGAKATSFAAVLRFEDRTVLAFQGTIFTSLDDWTEDFRAEYNEDPQAQLGLPGKIHEGFAHQLWLINDQILADLRQGFQGPLYITGHSQGAALAVLATRWLIQQEPSVKVAATYTFAAPRAGDATFAESLAGQEIYRVEFGDDIVPHVPLPAIEAANWLNNPFNTAPLQRLISTVANGFVAVGSLVYRALGLHEPLQSGLSETDEAKLTADRRKRLARAGAVSLANHLMANYLAMFDDDMWKSIAQKVAGQVADPLRKAEQKIEDLVHKIPVPKMPKIKLPFQ